jgi:NAD(P)-dependent dehydrogenase (short-subunit alcohol dehydrogenase family)
MDPKGHAALVTGGGSGLGRATAAKLASAGAKVAILDINIDAARAAAAKIGGIAIACDVADADQTAAAVAQARAQQGPARILINCAGIGPAKRVVGRDGPMPLDDFTRVINVNLVGTFNVIRLAAHAMSTLPLEDGERGVIVRPRRWPPMKARSDRPPIPPRRAASPRLMLPRRSRELAQFGIRVCGIAPGFRNCADGDGNAGGGAVQPRRRDPCSRKSWGGRSNMPISRSTSSKSATSTAVIRLDGAIRMAPR